jgi:hypothetical protein
MIILTGTPYDSKRRRNATGDLIANISNLYFVPTEDKTVIGIVGVNPGFKVGDNIKVVSVEKTFTTKISDITAAADQGSYGLFLDAGIDYTDGQMITNGTVSKVTSVVAIKTNWKKYLLIGVVLVGAFLLYKKFVKGKK